MVPAPKLANTHRVSTEIPAAAWAEEEGDGEVRSGGHDCGPAHLHRVVPAALHVPGQVCGRCGQQAAGRLAHHHPGRLPGTYVVTGFNTKE